MTQLRKKNQEQSLNKKDSQDARPRQNKTTTKGEFNYLDFFSIFSGRKFGSNPFPPQKKCDTGRFEPGSLTRPATSGCRTISPFTASAWERVGIEKEFKYTYLQYTYTTAGDTNCYSNVSWVWYLGVLTCIVNKLVCANSDDTVEVKEHYAAITSLRYKRFPHFLQ